ncbi:hypothetical protein KCP69_26205 [Salmonella enterica subsp. enterica]|nr:hypothetical protein KCP69_26205 [Salmonella enterica subsp. enterica]
MFAAEQRVNGFMDTNVAQRDGRTTIFKDFRHVVVRLYARRGRLPYRIGATRASRLQGGRYVNSARASDVHPAVSRMRFRRLASQRDARQVKR